MSRRNSPMKNEYFLKKISPILSSTTLKEKQGTNSNIFKQQQTKKYKVNFTLCSKQ